MATYKYSIVGPGSSSSDPVVVRYGCGATTVLVCWTGRLSTNGKCGEDMYFDEEYCDSVSVVSSTGTISWNGLYVHYKLIDTCAPEPHYTCESGCIDTTLTAYASPMYISDSGNTSIYYDSVVKCYGRVSGVIPKSGITFGGKEETEVPFATPYGCGGKVVVYKAEEGECTPGCKADLSVSVNREYVPASGTSISGSEITFRYKKVTTDDECNKRTTDGIFIYDDTLIVNVSGCTSGASGSGNEYQCCHDHYVNMDIPVSGLSKYLSGCTVYYDGKAIENISAGTIPYSILQKAKTSGECSGVCEEKTTYCVDSGSVKVCYEDGYMTNKWLCSGDTTSGCDCTSLSISGFNGNYAVPYTGGRIKVSWNYSASTLSPSCSQYSTSGTWEEIILVGGCDERPTSCNTEYNKIIYHDEQGHSVETTYDDKTYSGCKECDAECCYNYDGSGTSKCVILFKEQTPSCTTCDSCTVWDSEEERNITYNKIRYEFVQDCNQICEAKTSYKYDQKVIEITAEAGKECESYTTHINAEVPYSSITEYIGYGCPSATTTPGSSPIHYEGDITAAVNYSSAGSVVFENEYVKVIRKDVCKKEEECDCYGLELTYTPSECECNVTIVQPIDGSGSETPVEIGTYEVTGCEGKWSAVKTEGDDFLQDFSFSSNKIFAKVISLPEGTSERVAKYTFSIGTCSKPIEIKQKVMGECDCDKLSVTINGEVPGKKLDDYVKIGTFEADVECGRPITFKHKDGEGDDFIELKAEGNDINGKIKESNPGDDTRSSVYYIMQGEEGKQGSCSKEFTVTQAVATACTCEDIGSDVSVETNTHFNNEAHNNVEIATYYTNKCGSVSATTMETGMLEGGDVKTSSFHQDEHGMWIEDNEYEENAGKYVVKASIKENAGDLRSVGVTIHAKTNGSSDWRPCDKASFYIQQSDNFCQCEGMSSATTRIEKKGVAATGGERTYSQRIKIKPNCGAVKYTIEGDVPEGTVTNSYISRWTYNPDYNEDYLVISFADNTTSSAREFEVLLSVYANVVWINQPSSGVYRNEDWVSDERCKIEVDGIKVDMLSFIITQSGKSICDCSSIESSAVCISDINYKCYEDNKIQLDTARGITFYPKLMILSSDCSSYEGVNLTANFSEESNIERVDIGDYDASKHSWGLTVVMKPNTSTENPAENELKFAFCEGNEFITSINQPKAGTCSNCKKDFEDIIEVITSESGQCYGTSSEIIRYSGYCDVNKDSVVVTSGGEGWLNGFSDRELLGKTLITPSIEPNLSTNPRSFTYNVTAMTDSGDICTVGPHTFWQKGLLECNSSTINKDTVKIKKEGDGQEVHVGDPFVAGYVTISVKPHASLDCIVASVTTEQENCVDNLVIELEGDVTIDYYEGVSQKYKVTCRAIGSTAGLQDATVDTHFKVNGVEVTADPNQSLTIKIID